MSELQTPSWTVEFQRYLHVVFTFFSPPEKEHQLILLPMICSVCIAIFCSTLLFNGIVCDSLTEICPETFVIIPWGGYIVGTRSAARFITYAFHHLNFLHISTNLIVLFPTLYFLEKKYGFWRMLLDSVVSAIGGAIFAWFWMKPGDIVVGVSAVAYGYIFLYYADLIVNWYSCSMPKIELILSSTGLFSLIMEGIFNRIGYSNVATAAHLGGGLASLFFGLLVLPHFISQKWETWLPIIGLILMSLEFGLLPGLLSIYK